jgi:hypothetical protein
LMRSRQFLLTSIWSPFLLLAGNLWCRWRVLILIPWFLIFMKGYLSQDWSFPLALFPVKHFIVKFFFCRKWWRMEMMLFRNSIIRTSNFLWNVILCLNNDRDIYVSGNRSPQVYFFSKLYCFNLAFVFSFWSVWHLKYVYDFGFDKGNFKLEFLNCNATDGMMGTLVEIWFQYLTLNLVLWNILLRLGTILSILEISLMICNCVFRFTRF